MRAIFISGPPRAGKDTLAQMLLQRLPNSQLMRLSDEIKRRAHRLYGVWHSNPAFLEAQKDEPHDLFLGRSPRDAYINMARFLEAMHGADFLGRCLAERVDELAERSDELLREVEWLVIPDLGRVGDAQALVTYLHPSSVFQVMLMRPGTTYVGDSRVPVDLSALGVDVVPAYNSGTLEDLTCAADSLVRQLL
jgi:hypothetical protein